jgi:hypothetical protein
VDAGLLCAGTSSEERSIFDECRRFVEENILAYALALNAWLRDAPPEPAKRLADGRYVDHNRLQQLTATLHACLGEKDEVKEWLAACLLKTVKDNQRWHKKTELIDGVAEAISWFGEQQKGIRYRWANTI